MTCEQERTLLHGYLDGELDAAGASEFERHLQACGECTRALEAQERLRSKLKLAELYEPAPVRLRARLRADLGAPPRLEGRSSSRLRRWRWQAIAATALLAVIGAWRLYPVFLGSAGEAGVASAIVDAHLRSLQPGHLVDVVSSDQHTVKPWFDGKVDFAPPVRDFAAEGFPLEGGRLDVVAGRPVAAVVYARRKHHINVFIWPTAEPDRSPSQGTRLGYHWLRWRREGMEAWAVSDLNPAELGELGRLLAR